MTESSKHRVEMTREFAVPPDRVYRALTDPTELAKWWGAKTEWWMSKAEADVKPGGRYRYDFRNADGSAASISGEFRVVDAPRRIVQTWRNSMRPGIENVLEYRLEPYGAGTRLYLTHSELDSAGFEDYSKGRIGVLLKLTIFLAAVAGTLPLTLTAEQKE